MLESLGNKFEADFVTHLERSSQKRQWKFGAVGAGVAGAISFAASPALLLPGLAVAAVAGGAGGYQWAKRKGKDSLKKHGTACGHAPDGSGHVEASSQRSTLRRLKYLVKWGHWQLLEYQDAPNELRAAVIDEVVTPFSPWVQRLFLLVRRKDTEVEVQEVFQHLAPLCQLLQRRTAFEAVLQSTRVVTEAAEQGVMDASHVERCRIVYPTLVEAIRLFGKLESEEEQPVLRDVAHQRMKVSEEAVREVLQQAAVQDVLQGRKRPKSPSSSQQGQGLMPVGREDSTGSDDPVRKPMREALEVPPEGVEEESGTLTGNHSEDEDFDYFSCSDAESSAGEGPPSPKKAQAAGTSYKRRTQSFPRGVGEHTWSSFDEKVFDLRGSSYLRDRRKVTAGPCMLELACVDFLRIGPQGPVLRASLHPDMYRAQSGDKRFLLIQNWIFPPFQAIIVGALQPDAPWLAEDTPQARVWQRFLAMNDEERRNCFKVIMSVEEGPWLVKRAVPKKPVIVGRQLKMDTFHEPDRFLEIVVDVSGGRTEQMATGMVMKASKGLNLAMTSLIEATREDELPEAPLLCAAMKNLDTSTVTCPAPPRG